MSNNSQRQGQALAQAPTQAPTQGQGGGTIPFDFETLININPKTMEMITIMNRMILYIFVIVATIIIVFFSSNIENTYPEQFHSFVQEPLYKILILFIIVLISEISLPLALLLAVLYLLMMFDVNSLSKTNLFETTTDKDKKDEKVEKEITMTHQ
jgi:hypothetical protein